MAYNAGTAFLQIVPSFAGVVTRIAEEANAWGDAAGAAFKASFESQVQDLNIGVNTAGVIAEIASVRAAAAKLLDESIVLKYAPIEDPVAAAAVEAELAALTADRQVQISPTIGAAASAKYMAEVTALVGFAAAAGTGGGAKGGGGGILSTLGWGGGMFGFAAFGSILSLMGFSLEHFVTTALGLIGSAAGALAGGALLALGSLGILGVGTLTDLGGIGQAAGDIKTTYTALSQYQTMQQALAKQIPQTAAAQTALNTALAGFAPAAQSAVLAAALTANQFHWLYDQATGTAEAIGANIINQALQVGEVFLPILGKFATINMGIIQRGLQPLFQFLGTTGVTVFTQLEEIFTARLPTAMAALNQGVQLLIKSIGFLATQTTGGFMAWLSALLTTLNTPAGFQKLEGVFVTLIQMAKDWFDLLKQVAITLFDLFTPSAGLGTSIVTTLTSMLKSLDAYLTSVSGSAMLHNVFTVHKAETIALLEFLGTLLSVGGQIGLILIPPFVSLATALLNVGNALLHIPFVGTVLAWAVAATFLWNRLKLVAIATTLIGIPAKVAATWAFLALLSTRIGLVALSMGGLAASIWGAVVAVSALAVATLRLVAALVAERVAAVLSWAATFLPIAIIIAGIVAVGAAIYLLVTHWQQVTQAVGVAAGVVIAFLESLPKRIVTAFGDAGALLFNVGKAIVQGLINGIEAMVGDVVSTLEKIVHNIQQIPVIGKLIGSPSPYFTMVGQAIGQGLVNGMTESQGAVDAAGRKMISGLSGPGGLGVTANSAASASISGAVNLNSAGNGSILGALKRIETAVTLVAPAVSTQVDTKLTNVIAKHALVTQQLARSMT